MNYEEFKQLHAQGQIRLDKSTVSDLMDDLPKKRRNSIVHWATAGVLSAVSGLLVLSMISGAVSIILGIVLIALATPWCFRKAKATGTKVVLDYAEENERFFQELLDRNALKAT